MKKTNFPSHKLLGNYTMFLVRAARSFDRYLGLKPRLSPVVPSGQNPFLRPVHEIDSTSTLEDDDEDSLPDVAQALCCHPLKVGLASEARSTEARWRTREDEGRLGPSPWI